MAIIGISGKIGSGKDLAGKIIQYLTCGMALPIAETKLADIFNNPAYLRASSWKIKKYAGKLKQITSLLTGIPVEALEEPEVKNSYLSPEWAKDGKLLTVRELLQKLGTDALRNVIHPNIHVNALFADYITVDKKVPNWIITDVRFENEAEAIKERGGLLIRIERDVELRFPELWNKFQNEREDEPWDWWLKDKDLYKTVYAPSEVGLDMYEGWDLQIHNNSTVRSLAQQLYKFLLKHGIRTDPQRSTV